MIGDVLATSEEMLPGPGTYDDGAHIRAARLGVFAVDSEEFAAVVEPATKTPVVLKKGDIVIGEVNVVTEGLVGVIAQFRVGDERQGISSDTNGTLHISKIADRYIAVLDEVFKKGDIVRAKVLQGEPSLQLTTVGEEFGVLKALCARCRHDLVRQGDLLECVECRHREVRYIAGDYGSGMPAPQREFMQGDEMQRGDRIQQVEGQSLPSRPPRRGPGGRGGPGGGRGGPRGGGGRGGPRGGDRRGGDRGGPRGGGRGGDRRGGDRRGGGGGGDRRGGDRRGGGRGGDRRGGGGGGSSSGGRGRSGE